MRTIFIILMAISCLGLSPKKTMNQPFRSELRTYLSSEEAEKERLLEYIESMLRLTNEKINAYKGNQDQLEAIGEILLRVNTDINSINQDDLSFAELKKLSMLQNELHRQNTIVSGLTRAKIIRDKISMSA